MANKSGGFIAAFIYVIWAKQFDFGSFQLVLSLTQKPFIESYRAEPLFGSHWASEQRTHPSPNPTS